LYAKPLSYFPKNGRRIGSYGYKHDVENWSSARGKHKYIANGAFILAAFREGFWVKATGINAVFNFSVPKQLTKKSCGQEKET
jgi:hypothetical protein